MTKPGPDSKPKYPIPWIATYFITALVLIIGSFAIVWYLERQPKPFDYSDPDMIFLESIVLSPAPGEGDFTHLNGGDWQALCLVGWQGDPGSALEGMKIPDTAVRALLDAHDALAPSVDKSGFVLVYVDGEGDARAVHHPHGFAFAHQGAAACMEKDGAIVALPVMPR